MPPAPSNRPNRDEPLVTPVRDRGDACPGALRLHTADDGALARVRVPAGVVSAAQAYALADAAERLGDGALDITSRGNLQLRGLEPGCAGELAELLDTAGLLPAPRHERVRNIVASPLSGLDGRGHLDVQPLVRELDALLCASERAPELSGRFLFALDDGRGDMAELAADVMLLAEPGGAEVRVTVGGASARVRAEDGPRTMLLAAEAFLDAASTTGTRAWRVRELPRSGAELADAPVWRGLCPRAQAPQSPVGPGPAGPVGSVDPVGPDAPESAAALRRGLCPPASAPQSPVGPEKAGPDRAGGPELAGAARATGLVGAGGPRPGPVGGGGGVGGVSVGVPFGRVSVVAWRALARVAQAHGTGELRVTPWRGVVVPGAGPEQLGVLAGAGLVTDPDSPWLGVGACTGRPGCAKSLADVRADATAHLAAGARGLPVYWSGCERRCGHPRGIWVDVVATGDGRYDLAVRGAGTDELPGRQALPELADALAAARTITTPTK
ncbi:cobalamin biosynthesis protein CobG [Streptomyces sp. NPDC006540]|uniref:cobalamin biosynthesis protein CobG n=1 Tax=Streptomyces sp. NPDC006540 TaxID=3155353 RepID=UPI0033BE24FA